jgi:segregation and condensation protein B
MSLKAKIEAVIYASEEPVTLPQLIGLLGQEAQAELDRLEDTQQTLDLAQLAPATLADADSITAAELTALAEESDDTPSPTELTSETPLAGEAETETGPPPAPGEAETTLAPTESPEPPPPDEKQQARADRDRARRLREYFRSLLDQLIADYANSERGLEIREVASGFRFATKPEYHDAVRGFVKTLKPPLKLSLQALETLAVVAYKQPVTAPEISEIRGVDSSGVLGSLISRKLIATAGRKQVIGRPILYKTSREFLLRFGLKDIAELPSIEEFEKLAGELEADTVQEEIPMPDPTPGTPEDLEAEREAITPQADGDPTPLDESSPLQTPNQPIDSPEDAEPDTVSTPEGDNEQSPDQPLEPV